ncbi:MAG TPA: hypothetical protein VGD97_00290 [Lacunisphaera sp.]
MKSLPLILGAAGILLAGCATPFRAPPDVAHIKLDRGDSPLVIIEKIWLERKHGPLAVTGYVIKRLNVDDTTNTHLDVTLFDSAGRVIRSSVEYFEPRQINPRYRRHNDARYRVLLDPFPVGTTRILVQAHEGGHS